MSNRAIAALIAAAVAIFLLTQTFYTVNPTVQVLVRQFGAIVASGSREEALTQLAVPTVVLHGDADPLVDISGGRRTAELVPGATFHQLDGMGHDLPEPYWDRIVGAVVDNIGRAG